MLLYDLTNINLRKTNPYIKESQSFVEKKSDKNKYSDKSKSNTLSKLPPTCPHWLKLSNKTVNKCMDTIPKERNISEHITIWASCANATISLMFIKF